MTSLLLSDMENQSPPVYLYEVDDLLGGDALSLQDLACLVGRDIRWLSIRGKLDNDLKKIA